MPDGKGLRCGQAGDLEPCASLPCCPSQVVVPLLRGGTWGAVSPGCRVGGTCTALCADFCGGAFLTGDGTYQSSAYIKADGGLEGAVRRLLSGHLSLAQS